MSNAAGVRAARRVAVIAAIAVTALPACATPRIQLRPSLPAGDERVYRLVAAADTTIDVPGIGPRDRTVLTAQLRIRIGRAAGKAMASVTLTPTAFERNGTAAEPPGAQSAEIVFDAAGRVESVAGAPGGATPFGGSADDLGSIFGSTIVRGPVRIADRWSEPLAGGDGSRRSRVAALRWVDGRRCAIIESATTRPVERVRETGGASLTLTGTEVAAVTTAFAFDAGLPVSVVAVAEGTFDVAGAPTQGTVTIRSTTTITLVRRGRTASPLPTATATARAMGSRRPARS